jgi:hypothetical protein
MSRESLAGSLLVELNMKNRGEIAGVSDFIDGLHPEINIGIDVRINRPVKESETVKIGIGRVVK